jgi:hypothetical protein
VQPLVFCLATGVHHAAADARDVAEVGLAQVEVQLLETSAACDGGMPVPHRALLSSHSCDSLCRPCGLLHRRVFRRRVCRRVGAPLA